MKSIYKVHHWYKGSEELYRELSDQYDRLTVEQCRRWLSGFAPRLPDVNGQPFSEESQEGWRNMLADMSMYFMTGERYANKDATIRQRITDHQRQADRLETATPVRGVSCLICRVEMVETDRTEMGDFNNEKILFMCSCPNCNRHRAFWEGGEEYRVKRPKCQKCQSELKETSSTDNHIITITQTCSACGEVTTEVHDYTPIPDPVIDENFEADRARFCLSEEEGQKYLAGRASVVRLSQLVTNQDKEKEEQAKEKLQQIQKLTLDQVSKKLSVELEPHNFANLIFGEAQMDKDIRVGFQIQDRAGRSDYDSRTGLQKLVIKTLKGTNWRLMTGGVTYRLGILSGRLRGFDQEKDLLGLAKQL
jgi:hypothetical protein